MDDLQASIVSGYTRWLKMSTRRIKSALDGLEIVLDVEATKDIGSSLNRLYTFHNCLEKEIEILANKL